MFCERQKDPGAQHPNKVMKNPSKEKQQPVHLLWGSEKSKRWNHLSAHSWSRLITKLTPDTVLSKSRLFQWYGTVIMEKCKLLIRNRWRMLLLPSHLWRWVLPYNDYYFRKIKDAFLIIEVWIYHTNTTQLTR